MANVLNEFLHSVSKGFQDAAFASFSRRRSTVRVDLSQSFAPPELDEKGDAGKGNSPAKELLAEINSDALPEPAAEKAPAKKSTKAKAGVVDSGKTRRGRK
jgi:hypothetical protein